MEIPPFEKSRRVGHPAGILKKMEPQQSNGILLEEGRFSVRYLDKAQDCLCRVTFDLTREFHVLIDCQESLHQLLQGSGYPLFRVEQPFQVVVPGAAKPIECHIAGPLTQQIIGDDPSVYVTLSPAGGDGLIDHGLRISRVNGAIINFNQYHLGREGIVRLEDETWIFELTPVEEARLLFPPNIQNESYSISHHLLLQKKDAGPFSCMKAEDALWSLSTFLSFCAERWVAPALIAGCDETGVGYAGVGIRSTRHIPKLKKLA